MKFKEVTKDDLDHFWAKSLGGREEDLNFNESKIVVRQEKTDYNQNRDEGEIDIFQQNNRRIISCSAEIEDKLRKHEAELLEVDITEKSIENIGLKVSELLGPAFLSFTTKRSFDRAESSNCGELTQEDAEDLEKLKQESDKEEIENSIGESKIGNQPLFGKFNDEELVAVSSYAVWDQVIGFPDVFVKKEFRGNGYGKQVVSASTEAIIENDLIPVYRTLEKWSSSVGLAKSLGYTKYATTYLIKLRE